MSKKNDSPPAATAALPTASDTPAGTPTASETAAVVASALQRWASIPVDPAVASAIARASVGVIPTPRGDHPGTIAMVTMFSLKVRVVPISEFPDHFIYANGSPVVREEFFSYDANGQPCPPSAMFTAHILRYGVHGQLVQTVYGGDGKRMRAAEDDHAKEKREKNQAWLKKAMEDRAERKKHKPQD